MFSENRGEAGRRSLSPRDPLLFSSVCSVLSVVEEEEVLNHGGHGDHGDEKEDVRWRGLCKTKPICPAMRQTGTACPLGRGAIVQNKANSQS